MLCHRAPTEVVYIMQQTKSISKGLSNLKHTSAIFDVQVIMHRDKFLKKKNQLDALISQIYFWIETLHVSDSSSVHHQEFFTVHTAMVYVIQVC